MTRRPRPTLPPTRHRQQPQRVWTSLLASIGILAAIAALLALHTLSNEPTALGAAISWSLPPAEPHALPPPARALPPLPPQAAPPWELEPLHLLVQEPLPPTAPELTSPILPPPAAEQELPEIAPDLPPPRRPMATSRPAATPAIVTSPPATEGSYTPPAYLQTPKPPYPAAMRQSRREGAVRLRIALDAQGIPQHVDIVTGSGYIEFDTTARQWVLSHWRFSPARRDGRPIPGSVITSVRFVLN